MSHYIRMLVNIQDGCKWESIFFLYPLIKQMTRCLSYLQNNNSQSDPLHNIPVFSQKIIYHVKITSSVSWNLLEKTKENIYCTVQITMNTIMIQKSSQKTTHFSPGFVKVKEGCTSQLNQDQQDHQHWILCGLKEIINNQGKRGE